VTTDAFIITCEHGGNRIPAPYRALFREQGELLDSHRGHDPGALLMARTLAQALRAPLVASTTSRLLVDLNRSPGHPRLFSPTVRQAPAALRRAIVAAHYLPYREQVEHLVAGAVKRGRCVIHISSHSFTPVLDGQVRSADVGLLYHPRRAGEVRLCAHWKSAILAHAPTLRVRRNYPYEGKGDGLTNHLRRHFPATAYLGIELEINQAIALQPAGRWLALRTMLVATLRRALATHNLGKS
jgi:predicted N-formylglutamate amidohydrolase